VSGVETKKPYYLVDLTVVDLVAEKRPVVVGRIFGDLFLVVVELESKVDIFFSLSPTPQQNARVNGA
jgi:hypothetical protein